MSTVEINAGGRSIKIEHDTELAYLQAAALELWRETEVPPEEEKLGGGFGFSGERRASYRAPDPLRSWSNDPSAESFSWLNTWRRTSRG